MISDKYKVAQLTYHGQQLYVGLLDITLVNEYISPYNP